MSVKAIAPCCSWLRRTAQTTQTIEEMLLVAATHKSEKQTTDMQLLMVQIGTWFCLYMYSYQSLEYTCMNKKIKSTNFIGE